MRKSTKAALNNNNTVSSNEQRVVGSGVAAAAAGSNQGRGANLVSLCTISSSTMHLSTQNLAHFLPMLN